MDLSSDLNLHEMKFIKKQSTLMSRPGQIRDSEIDLIDLDRIQFEDDESWLYSTSDSGQHIENLQSWMHSDFDFLNEDLPLQTTQSNITDSQRYFDSRTFTRPKKRFTRPSIEKYNEEVYGSNFNTNSNTTKDFFNSKELSSSFVISECSEPETQTKPLTFDLSQPSNSYYFDNIVANLGDSDSFQNMSPPSLVNSMCSSTFANLMESSFIKNDPVLRAISNTDFTETVLLQDSEPPMFQSITESCSSLNSDTPESFLRKVSRSDTFRKNASVDLDRIVSFESASDTMTIREQSQQTFVNTGTSHVHSANETQDKSPHMANFNGTYRRTPKFRRSKKNDSNLNDTFNISQEDMPNIANETQILTETSLKSSSPTKSLIRENTIEDMKKQLSDTVKITDLNRLSYCLDDNVRIDSGYNEEKNDMNKALTIKRSSISTGSADSLDRLSSSLSSSSRGSNRMLNMADVDAIVEMQEKSLQIMSTPKVTNRSNSPKKLWENNFISPIVNIENRSDSDLSSNDDYKSIKSTYSKGSIENHILSKPRKTLASFGGHINTKIKTTQRSTYTLNAQKPLQANPNLRGSYNNLRSVQTNIPGSQNNIYRASTIKSSSATTNSNLKSMGPKLKGSYTSLKPISANLPVVPPINSNFNVTKTLPKATNPNVTQTIDSHTKILEVPPTPREKNVIEDTTFVKPQPRASALPRPTGIPRPTSKIPAPRNRLLASSKSSLSRPDLREGFQ